MYKGNQKKTLATIHYVKAKMNIAVNFVCHKQPTSKLQIAISIK